MFGMDGNNAGFPVFLNETRFQYDINALPQLQLFGDFSAGCSMRTVNHMGNEHVTPVDQPIKRSCEVESIPRQQKHHISLNNNLIPDETGQHGSVLNPNPVLMGLKLSCEEDERNSSVTSVRECMTALPVLLSVSDNLKTEIERQKEEFGHYIRLQEENLIKGVREMSQRQTVLFLNALDKGVCQKLQKKELEIENMNRKNKELVEKIKQASMEVQSWQCRAKYNESIINVMKSNLKQAAEQGASHSKEGCGDSEVNDVASYTNPNNLEIAEGLVNLASMSKLMSCRACMIREVAVLLLPCRHLCLCKDCEGFIEICPICQVMKKASVEIYMS